jgi:hypothetical protein
MNARSALNCQTPVRPGVTARRCQWRADKGHVAFDDVKELRQFIETGFAEPAADARDPGITIRCWMKAIFRSIDVHGAEFEKLEGSALAADPQLLEERRAFGFRADKGGKNRPKRQGEYEEG